MPNESDTPTPEPDALITDTLADKRPLPDEPAVLTAMKQEPDALIPDALAEWPPLPDDRAVLAAMLAQADAFLSVATALVNRSRTLKSLLGTPGGERVAQVGADDLDGLLDRLDLWGLDRFSPCLPPRANTIRARFYLKRLGRHRARRDYYRGDADSPRAVQGYPPVLRSQGPEAFEILVDDARSLARRIFVKLGDEGQPPQDVTGGAPASDEDQRAEYCYEQGCNRPDLTWRQIGAECREIWSDLLFDDPDYASTLARRWKIRRSLEPIPNRISKRIKIY